LSSISCKIFAFGFDALSFFHDGLLFVAFLLFSDKNTGHTRIISAFSSIFDDAFCPAWWLAETKHNLRFPYRHAIYATLC